MTGESRFAILVDGNHPGTTSLVATRLSFRHFCLGGNFACAEMHCRDREKVLHSIGTRDWQGQGVQQRIQVITATSRNGDNKNGDNCGQNGDSASQNGDNY